MAGTGSGLSSSLEARAIQDALKRAGDLALEVSQFASAVSRSTKQERKGRKEPRAKTRSKYRNVFNREKRDINCRRFCRLNCSQRARRCAKATFFKAISHHEENFHDDIHAGCSFSCRYLVVWRIPSGRFPLNSFWRELYAYVHVEARSAERARRIRWPAIRSQFIHRTPRPRDRADDDWISFTNPHGINKTSASRITVVGHVCCALARAFHSGWPWYRWRARWDNIYSYTFGRVLFLILFGFTCRRRAMISQSILHRPVCFTHLRPSGPIQFRANRRSAPIHRLDTAHRDYLGFFLLARARAGSCSFSQWLHARNAVSVSKKTLSMDKSVCIHRVSHSVYRARSVRARLIPS